jgi:hypothetical protein
MRCTGRCISWTDRWLARLQCDLSVKKGHALPRGLIQKRTTIVEIRQAGNGTDKNVGFGAKMPVQSPDNFRVILEIFGNFAIPGSFPAIFQPAWTSPDSARTHAETAEYCPDKNLQNLGNLENLTGQQSEIWTFSVSGPLSQISGVLCMAAPGIRSLGVHVLYLANVIRNEISYLAARYTHRRSPIGYLVLGALKNSVKGEIEDPLRLAFWV